MNYGFLAITKPSRIYYWANNSILILQIDSTNVTIHDSIIILPSASVEMGNWFDQSVMCVVC